MTKTEQTVLQNLQLQYDEVNALGYLMQTGTFWEYPKEEARRAFEECLFWFYVDGYSSGILMLDEDGLIESMPNGYEFLDVSYDGETVLQKFDKYYDEKDAGRMQTLLESESHRMYGTGGKQAAEDVKQAEAKNGKQSFITKRWNTMQDDRVRDLHQSLEGKVIPYNEDFVADNGDHGFAPGLFELAESNANCRCYCTYLRQ